MKLKEEVKFKISREKTTCMESKISNNRGTNSEELKIQSRKIPSERFHYLRSIINKDG